MECKEVSFGMSLVSIGSSCQRHNMATIELTFVNRVKKTLLKTMLGFAKPNPGMAVKQYWS